MASRRDRRDGVPAPPSRAFEGEPVFEPGALTSGLLTGLREGVEAALIISIVLAWIFGKKKRIEEPEEA